MSCWKWKTFNKYEPRERTYIKNTHQRSNGRNCPPASQHKRMSLNTNVPGRKNERDCFFRALVTAVLQIFFLWYHFFQLYFNRHTHTHIHRSLSCVRCGENNVRRTLSRRCLFKCSWYGVELPVIFEKNGYQFSTTTGDVDTRATAKKNLK